MSGNLHNTVAIKTDLSLPPSKGQKRMKNNSYYNYIQHVSNQMQQMSAKYLVWFDEDDEDPLTTLSLSLQTLAPLLANDF